MNNINENNKILNISFNQDNSCFCLSTEKGFKIYDTYPIQTEYEKPLGSLIFAEMYYNSNILALVSGGDSAKFSPKKLIIWDDALNKVIREINFFKKIKNVKLKKERIYVICEFNLYIFNLKTAENLEIIDTYENQKGLFSINSDEKNDVIAYLKPFDEKENKKGIVVKIKNYELNYEKEINTKEESISYICLNNYGDLIAIANEKGNEIKIYSCLNGELLNDFHRGKEKAEINYICFDKYNNYLAITSDRGTIHIWSLKGALQKLNDIKRRISKDMEENNKEKEYEIELNNDSNKINDLPSNKKSMFSQNEKSFAKIRINSNKSICSFQENNIIIVVTFEGKYYQALLDTKHGGDCQINGEIDLKI